MKWLNDEDLLVCSIPERVVFRQVGWIGQSGALYTKDENPAETEPGSFSPVFIEVES